MLLGTAIAGHESPGTGVLILSSALVVVDNGYMLTSEWRFVGRAIGDPGVPFFVDEAVFLCLDQTNRIGRPIHPFSTSFFFLFFFFMSLFFLCRSPRIDRLMKHSILFVSFSPFSSSCSSLFFAVSGRCLHLSVFVDRQVRLGVIRQLADFFREMNPQQREKHLNVLVEVRDVTAVNC